MAAPTEKSGLVDAGRRPSARFVHQSLQEKDLRGAFFWIGCGSSITFNAVVMGVARVGRRARVGGALVLGDPRAGTSNRSSGRRS